MPVIESRLQALNLILPPEMVAPGVELPFAFVRVIGTRALIAGHGPQLPDGSMATPLGRVGSELTEAQAYEAARRAIIRCGAKGFDLPREKYDHWRDIKMTFNPEKMRIK